MGTPGFTPGIKLSLSAFILLLLEHGAPYPAPAAHVLDRAEGLQERRRQTHGGCARVPAGVSINICRVLDESAAVVDTTNTFSLIEANICRCCRCRSAPGNPSTRGCGRGRLLPGKVTCELAPWMSRHPYETLATSVTSRESMTCWDAPVGLSRKTRNKGWFDGLCVGIYHMNPALAGDLNNKFHVSFIVAVRTASKPPSTTLLT